jgi:hypothetical protein
VGWYEKAAQFNPSDLDRAITTEVAAVIFRQPAAFGRSGEDRFGGAEFKLNRGCYGDTLEAPLAYSVIDFGRQRLIQTKNYERLRSDFGTPDEKRGPMAPGWRPGHSLAGLAGFGRGSRTHRRTRPAKGRARCGC